MKLLLNGSNPRSPTIKHSRIKKNTKLATEISFIFCMMRILQIYLIIFMSDFSNYSVCNETS